jgi:peptidoglycan/LPS O-acetylase OafA/YrhL
MRELKQQNDTTRPRQHDDRTPRQSKLVAGGAMALMFGALFTLWLFRAPQSVWALLLVAALALLTSAIALGFLQWDGGIVPRRRQPAETTDWPEGDSSAKEGAVLSTDEQERLLDIERRFAVDDPEFDQSFRSRFTYYERVAVRAAVLVAALLSALMLLVASLTDTVTFGTASGLLGWVAALAFAITTVLPGWLLRRSSGMRRSA